MLWPIDSCQNRISTDQYVAGSGVLRDHVVFQSLPLISYEFLIDRKRKFHVFQSGNPQRAVSWGLESSFIQDRLLCSGYKSHYSFLM